MKKEILLFSLLTLVLITSPISAEPKISFDVKLLAQHEKLVTLGWEAIVQSDRAWDACDLIISFKDDRGREIHAFRETLQLRVGSSTHSGVEICDSGVWKRVKKYDVTLDCVF